MIFPSLVSHGLHRFSQVIAGILFACVLFLRIINKKSTARAIVMVGRFFSSDFLFLYVKE
ncbi:hypothetical protein DBR28_18835 [Chryseobacterium sp. HMWF028]|nr:hypothetical protein DBR28_18835 [Chryseobacterium sp. HMWF028]